LALVEEGLSHSSSEGMDAVGGTPSDSLG